MKRSIFCHVRKTGGTTLHRIFQDAVGVNDLSPGHGSEQYSNALHRWEDLTVISQHLWFAPGETLSEERTNLTILRSPIERVVSNYFYVRAQDGVFNPDAIERRLSLLEFVESQSDYARTEVENHQTKLFSALGLSPEERLPSDDRILSAAKGALEQFQLVGLTERLEETIDLVSYVTGMKAAAIIPRERATDSRPSMKDLPSDLLRNLKQLNSHDEELYAHAAKAFASLRRRCFLSLLDLKEGSLPAIETGRVAAKAANGETQVTRESSPARPKSSDSRWSSGRFGTREIEIVGVRLRGSVSLGAPDFISGEYLSLTIQCRSKIEIEDVTVGLHIHDAERRLVYGTNTWHLGKSISAGPGCTFEVTFRFQVTMGTGRYQVGITLHTGNSHLERCFDWYDGCATFGVAGLTGFHFDGLVSLAPSVLFQCDGGDGRLTDAEHGRSGFVALGRQNRPIVRPEGRVVSLTKKLDVHGGDVFALELEIANAGDVTWQEEGRRCAKLCYRWLRPDGTALVEEGPRSNIGGDLFPGESRRVWMTVCTPLEHVGTATLRITLLQEHVAWFDHIGKLCCDVPTRILGGKE